MILAMKTSSTLVIVPLLAAFAVLPAQEPAKEKPAQGTVVAIGAGKLLDDGTRAPFTVKVGDVVIYSKYAGHELTIDGEEYKVIQESDVYAVID